MIDEQTKKELRKNVHVLLKAEITVLGSLGIIGEDMAEGIEYIMDKLQKTYELEDDVGECKKMAALSKELGLVLPLSESCSRTELTDVQELVFTMCRNLNDPIEIMKCVQTITDLTEIWLLDETEFEKLKTD